MKRYEVNRLRFLDSGTRIEVSENHTNPDGKVVTFPAFSLSIEDATELVASLRTALAMDRFHAKSEDNVSDDELEFRQADDSIGGGITGGGITG